VIDATLSKRYAKALVEIGQEKNALDTYTESVTALCDLMETSKDFREVLINPVFTTEDKKRIAGQVMEKMNTDPMVSNFVNLLIDRKRIEHLPGIADAMREMLDEIQGITRAEVLSASELSEDELNTIAQTLSQISGKTAQVKASVDPSLIGGIYAKVGDMVFDGTIRTQLNQLKETLKG
jgi:F-type H+-transporting ATPase subunit delta